MTVSFVGNSFFQIVAQSFCNTIFDQCGRFHNRLKQLIFDIAKIIITVKVKRGEHRLFRLAENLGINLILNLKEVLLVKKELKVIFFSNFDIILRVNMKLQGQAHTGFATLCVI